MTSLISNIDNRSPSAHRNRHASSQDEHPRALPSCAPPSRCYELEGVQASRRDDLPCRRRRGQSDRHPERHDKDWVACDELCKAIITLNVRDFPRYGVSAGKETAAHDVWAQLVEIHSPKRWCGLFEWIRPLTRLEWILLAVMAMFALLFTIAAADVQLLRAEVGSLRAAFKPRVSLSMSERLLQDAYGLEARRLKYADL